MGARRRSRSHRTAALVTRNLLPAFSAAVLAACQPPDRYLAPLVFEDAGTAPAATANAGAGGADAAAGEDTRIESLSPAGETALAGDENSCTSDAGACMEPEPPSAGEPECPGCLIEGECIGAAAVDEANACRVCDPERDPAGWSPNEGASCDDGLYCTTTDVCGADGACSGAPLECDDGVVCNGVSTCDEEAGACTPDTNECGANFLCNVATDTCVTTCNGCLVDGVCVAAGTEAAGNPCLVCNPSLSTTAFSAAPGKACGTAANTCSAQDTCDAQGGCQPNHLPAGTPCGSSSSSACDQADACDGAGRCLQRLSPNGTQCDDGAFCTVEDQCQGGQCVDGGNRNCGANQVCNEATNRCACSGCTISGMCVASGTQNPANPCQICDPVRSTTAFSVNANAPCGGGLVCAPDARCKSPLGGDCRSNEDCVSGRCDSWFRDADGDGHGDPSQLTGTCGTATNPVRPAGFVASGDDCCDASSLIVPGQTTFFSEPQTACPNVSPFDYNCDGSESDHLDFRTGQGQFCARYFPDTCVGQVWASDPNCGQLDPVFTCARQPDGVCDGVRTGNGELARTVITVQCR